MVRWYISKGAYYILPKRKKRVKHVEKSFNEATKQ